MFLQVLFLLACISSSFAQVEDYCYYDGIGMVNINSNSGTFGCADTARSQEIHYLITASEPIELRGFIDESFQFVFVYDGPDQSSPLLGAFNDDIEQYSYFSSSGNQVLVVYTNTFSQSDPFIMDFNTCSECGIRECGLACDNSLNCGSCTGDDLCFDNYCESPLLVCKADAVFQITSSTQLGCTDFPFLSKTVSWLITTPSRITILRLSSSFVNSITVNDNMDGKVLVDITDLSVGDVLYFDGPVIIQSKDTLNTATLDVELLPVNPCEGISCGIGSDGLTMCSNTCSMNDKCIAGNCVSPYSTMCSYSTEFTIDDESSGILGCESVNGFLNINYHISDSNGVSLHSFNVPDGTLYFYDGNSTSSNLITYVNNNNVIQNDIYSTNTELYVRYSGSGPFSFEYGSCDTNTICDNLQCGSYCGSTVSCGSCNSDKNEECVYGICENPMYSCNSNANFNLTSGNTNMFGCENTRSSTVVSWLLQEIGGVTIYLQLNDYLDFNGAINFYNGPSSSSSLIISINERDIIPIVSSTSDTMYIEFTSFGEYNGFTMQSVDQIHVLLEIVVLDVMV